MADISLLDDVQPNHPKLTRFSRDPKRYADEILYTLLDFCDEEEITGSPPDCRAGSDAGPRRPGRGSGGCRRRQ